MLHLPLETPLIYRSTFHPVFLFALVSVYNINEALLRIQAIAEAVQFEHTIQPNI